MSVVNVFFRQVGPLDQTMMYLSALLCSIDIG